mmetsp:Transcript_30084/g.79257  ORF Transcript_30084/g.79257 Transcript_30084/m.79257 type:complete len:559 (-) Transcript_30084:61-1737(-)
MASPPLLAAWVALLTAAAASQHLAAAAVAAAAAGPPASSGRKNILYIVSDDLRPELGAYGMDRRTPSLDALAAGGTVFLRAYAQQALCGPSRNSFMTGRRPDRTRSWNQMNHFRQQGPEWTTLPGLFKKNGYLTLGTGKLYHPCPAGGKLANHSHRLGDCGGPPEYDGEKSWSREALPYDNPCWLYGIQCYPCPKWPSHLGPGWNATKMQWCELDALDDARTLSKALDMLKTAQHASAGGRPFFLGVGFHKPHLPWQASKKFFDLYPLENVSMPRHPHPPVGMPDVAYFQASVRDPETPLGDSEVRQSRRAYWATVAEMDSRVGQLLAELDRLGLANDTAVVFHGDHGWSLGEQNEWRKFTNFENSARVPLIVRAPWVRGSAGLQAGTLAELVDVMPTLAELAGVDLPSGEALDGTSLVPAMQGSPEVQVKPGSLSQFPRRVKDPKRAWHSNGIDHAPSSSFTHMGYSLRTREWRYTEWLEWDGSRLEAHWDRPPLGVELYDHQADPGFPTDFDSFENENLAGAAEYANVTAHLARQLRLLVGAPSGAASNPGGTFVI